MSFDSTGPLPEDLLSQVQRPVRILWGENDPWEPIADGRKLAKFNCVDEFVALKGAIVIFICVFFIMLIIFIYVHCRRRTLSYGPNTRHREQRIIEVFIKEINV